MVALCSKKLFKISPFQGSIKCTHCIRYKKTPKEFDIRAIHLNLQSGANFYFQPFQDLRNSADIFDE